MSQPIERFKAFQPYWQRRAQKLRHGLFKRMTKNALPLFFKGGDIISNAPLTSGVYESEVKQLIDHAATCGFSDFLIDIGANIGLTSCQSGHQFKAVHLFEPNPLALSILKVNLKIMLKRHPYTIHEYGLGANDDEVDLYVPYDNWGGAFVMSDHNAYDLQLLAQKDGWSSFDPQNYERHTVAIRSAHASLTALFAELEAQGLRKGVIKIDVEGFERFVIEQVVQVIKSRFECILIFENWKNQLAVADLALPEGVSFQAYALAEQNPPMPHMPRFLRSLYHLLRGGYVAQLTSVVQHWPAGTCVIRLN